MNKKGNTIEKSDIVFLVAATSASIIGTAALCAIPTLSSLYVGMLGVLFYMLLLGVYIGYKRSRPAPKTYITPQITAESNLTDAMASFAEPAIITNENGVILWFNPAFLTATGVPQIEEGSLMDDFCRLIRSEREEGDASSPCFFNIGNGFYQSESLHLPADKSLRLIVFRDKTEFRVLQTDYNLLRQKYEDANPAVAYVLLDNVEDLLQHIQDSFRDAANKVAEILHRWVEQMGGILRSYDRDKYLILFDKKQLDDCIKKQFPVLEEIRGVMLDDGVPVTVSIGICCTSGSLAQKENLAQAALDMALQRGGDQVVYRSDTGTDYFGGKTKAIYKRANVRARTVGKQLVKLFAYADNVLIMGHNYGDFDSFGAAIGIARLAQCYSVSDVHIVCKRSDPNLGPCFDKLPAGSYDHIFLTEAEALALVRPKTLLVIVDVNNCGNMESKKLFDAVDDIVIIDHHTQTSVFEKQPKIAYIEPSASSASELVAEILEQYIGAKRLPKEEAELMLSGILLDTKQLVRNTGTRTFGAIYFLRGEGADPSEAHEFFKSDVQDLVKQSRFLLNVLVYKEVIAIAVCEGETDPSFRVIAAKAADRLLSGKGIAASFAIVTINGKIHISGRSDGTINVAKILEELHGGGHFDAAGAQIEVDPNESPVDKLRTVIDKYVK